MNSYTIAKQLQPSQKQVWPHSAGHSKQCKALKCKPRPYLEAAPSGTSHNQQTHVQSLGSKYVMATLAQFVKLNSIVGMRQCSIIPNTYVPTYMYLYHGWFSLTNHVAVLEVSISDRHLVGGIYLDRHLPLICIHGTAVCLTQIASRKSLLVLN